MDVATHLLLPYAAALAGLGFLARGREPDRKRAALAAVFGIAGAAPDADGVLSWLKRVDDSFYWLQHRGISHSLLGAPLFALAVVALLALAARRWPRRLSLFAWRPAFVAAAILGSWTHLLLDGVTYGGIPLAYPFAFGRWGFPLFHWLVAWMFPLAAAVLLAHAFGRLDRRGVIVAAAILVVVLLALAGLRFATRPDGEWVYPRVSETEWLVIERVDGGYLARSGDDVEPYADGAPAAAADAIARAKDTASYRGFLMGAFGPIAQEATPAPGGGWIVTFTCVAQRFEATHDPSWTPTRPFDEWGVERVLVRADDIAVLNAGW